MRRESENLLKLLSYLLLALSSLAETSQTKSEGTCTSTLFRASFEVSDNERAMLLCFISVLLIKGANIRVLDSL